MKSLRILIEVASRGARNDRPGAAPIPARRLRILCARDDSFLLCVLRASSLCPLCFNGHLSSLRFEFR